MRLKKVIYCLLLVLCLIISWTEIAQAEELPIDFKLDAGYCIDNLRWNIAGDSSGKNPNILSDLSWSDIKILQIYGLATIPLKESLFLQGSLNLGVIISSNNQDSDYLGDNRTEEFSRSNNSSNGDNVFGSSIAAGYYLTSGQKKFRLAPMIGYSFNRQMLRMTDGYQTINIDPDTGASGYTGPLSGLNSSYKASWSGPWLGANFSVNLSPKWTTFSDFDYHWVNYYGEGNWNLRDDLAHPMSFTHIATGNGYHWSAGVNFSPNSQFKLILKFHSGVWSAGPGIDQVFGANGDTGITRLNEVVWASQAVMLTFYWSP
ncbi:MAG TPA: hypothetical protein VHY08_06240 [Bacillota bacterium]|nr:hypothetical protein [Bacillota bacterium]